MIEVISAERCTRCNICVRICPTDVFDLVADGPPVIARQDSCQTCFMCEAHCPADAMYVAPQRTPVADGSPHADERRVTDAELLGSYRARLGWGGGRRPPTTVPELLDLARGGAPVALAGFPTSRETP